jgi:hypothetical protein
MPREWGDIGPGMSITLSAMITPTSTDAHTMWGLLSAVQTPIGSYRLLECRLDYYRLLVRQLTSKSVILLLQLIDLQLIIKIILFQKKTALAPTIFFRQLHGVHEFSSHQGFVYFSEKFKRFCIGNLNYFQMHLGFLVVFKIIHVYTNFLFQIEYGLNIEPLPIRTHTFIFMASEENFEAFHIDFGADRLMSCTCPWSFHINDTVTLIGELNKIWIVIFGSDFDFI